MMMMPHSQNKCAMKHISPSPRRAASFEALHPRDPSTGRFRTKATPSVSLRGEGGRQSRGGSSSRAGSRRVTDAINRAGGPRTKLSGIAGHSRGDSADASSSVNGHSRSPSLAPPSSERNIDICNHTMAANHHEYATSFAYPDDVYFDWFGAGDVKEGDNVKSEEAQTQSRNAWKEKKNIITITMSSFDGKALPLRKDAYINFPAAEASAVLPPPFRRRPSSPTPTPTLSSLQMSASSLAAMQTLGRRYRDEEQSLQNILFIFAVILLCCFCVSLGERILQSFARGCPWKVIEDPPNISPN